MILETMDNAFSISNSGTGWLHTPGNLCIIEPEAQSPCTRTATDTRRCYNEIVLARLKHCPSSCRLS